MLNGKHKPEVGAEAAAPPSTDLTMSFGIVARANCHRDDPRIMQLFQSEEWMQFLSGPLSIMIFEMMRQYVVSKDPTFIINPIPAEKPNAD